MAAPRRRLQRLAATVVASDDAVAVPTLQATLHSGDQMPMVGFGLWKVGREICADTVYNAIKAGYRCFDGACDYGNEVECGEGLRRAISEGLVRREDVWVTSKLWNTYHRREHVPLACQRSLRDWGLSYFDLYLVHFPISLKFVPFEERYPPEWFHDPAADRPCMAEDPVPMHETWEAMEGLVSAGLARNIGMCNVGTSLLRDMLSYAKIRPSALQVELHPYNTQQKLVRFCQEQGIVVMGFSSLGAGSYVELGAAAPSDSVLNEAVVQAIGKSCGRSPAQVVLRWALQRGTAVVPKTTSQARLLENLDVQSFSLTPEEMEAIGALNRNRRFNDPGVFCEGAFNTFFPIYE